MKKYASDLSVSLNNRLEICVTKTAGMANFFDIEETFIHLCGEKLENGRIKIKEGDLEEFGNEVCRLKHIATLQDEHFDERMNARKCSSRP